jgi:hypothetical protein
MFAPQHRARNVIFTAAAGAVKLHKFFLSTSPSIGRWFRGNLMPFLFPLLARDEKVVAVSF